MKWLLHGPFTIAHICAVDNFGWGLGVITKANSLSQIKNKELKSKIQKGI